MALRVGIKGFGRIGRNFVRAHIERGGGFEGVAVNDGEIRAQGQSFKVLAERDPKALPWGDLGVDVVVESTGLFTDREGAAQHLDGGAPRVIISAPAKEADATFVIGVNDDTFDPGRHTVVSNASCTTN